MKVTMKQYKESEHALAELSRMKIPAYLAMKILLVQRAAKGPVAVFDTQWNKLIEEVGEPLKDHPGRFEVKDKDRFNEESEPMLATEIDIPIDRFSVTLFKDAAISASMLESLSWLITE
jgi:hypothetical protein